MLSRIILLTPLLVLTACSSGSNEPAQPASAAEQSQALSDDPVQVNNPVQVNDPGQASDSGQISVPAQPEPPQFPPLSDDTSDGPVVVGIPVQESIVTTETGLQYLVLKAAEGPKPNRDSVVTVHYLGTLLDGTEFDSSYSRGAPSTFSLAQVIAGWTEGVQLMSVGSRYRFIVPADLAYGDRGRGDLIKPGDTLVFEVELIEINSM